MKKKLLFWLSVGLTHLGLAYYLKEKLDGEFYAIIDTTNKPKQMFLTQKLVDFRKTWYFHDHIKKTTKKPNLEFLSHFEKKYHIDLWKLAINERHFYRFNRFYKFTTNEILSFLEQECKLYEQILDEIKPDYFLTYDPPFHHQKLLLDLCKAKEIKVLCLYIARFRGDSIIADDGATFSLPQNLDLVELTESEKSHLEQKENDSQYNKFTKKWINERSYPTSNKLKALKDYIFSSDSKNTQSNFTYYGRDKLKVILDTISFYIKLQTRSRYLQNNSKKTVDLNVPFVYFPLGMDEELNLLHYAPFFTNQIEAVKHVAKSLPIDYRLYVKDHIYGWSRAWRDVKQYKELTDIPNVTLIHPSYSSRELTKNSKLLAAVRGTASFDAAYENKPSIIFGGMPHDMLPSVYRVESLEDLPNLIRTALNTPVNPLYVKKFVKLMRERVFDFNLLDYEMKRNNQFYSGGILSDVEFPENKVKEFFETNKVIFETLSNAYLAKIN